MDDGAQRIISRIMADAGTAAESARKEAAAKAAAIVTAAQENAAARRERILEQAAKEAAGQKRRIIGVAQLEARKELLAAKQQLIEEAFQQSLHELSDLNVDAYQAVLRDLLLAVVETGNETVFLSPRDRERIPACFWEEINQALKAAGKEGQLTLSGETRAIRGGFILQSGGVEINCSFESLLEMQRDALEPAVAKILFG
jgi:V/A-type H+-transporting ATPase subunit E